MKHNHSKRDIRRLEQLQYLILGLIGFHIITFWELGGLMFIAEESGNSRLASNDLVGLCFVVCLAVFLLAALGSALLVAFILRSWPILLCWLAIVPVPFASIGLLLLWGQVIKHLQRTPGTAPQIPPLRRCPCGGEMIALKVHNWILPYWFNSPAGFDLEYECAVCSKHAMIVDEMRTGFSLLVAIGGFCIFLPSTVWLFVHFRMGILGLAAFGLMLILLGGLVARYNIKIRNQHPPVFRSTNTASAGDSSIPN